MHWTVFWAAYVGGFLGYGSAALGTWVWERFGRERCARIWARWTKYR